MRIPMAVTVACLLLHIREGGRSMVVPTHERGCGVAGKRSHDDRVHPRGGMPRKVCKVCGGDSTSHPHTSHPYCYTQPAQHMKLWHRALVFKLANAVLWLAKF